MRFTDAYFGYIEKLGGDGWLRIKFDDGGGMIWPLPEYLKVSVRKSSEREEFVILEGRFKGRKATVKKKGWRWDQWDWDKSFFEARTKRGSPYKKSAELTFYLRSNKLEISELGEFNAKTDPVNPVPIGKYDIELPYEPHGLGSHYIEQATYAKTWFRIDHSGDRFLHCGQVSAGCITVTDINKLDIIYKHLIISRKDPFNVGEVNVVDR